MPFGMEKLEWCGYPIVKKFRRYLYSFDMIHERDRHTHRHTHTLRDGIRAYAVLMHSIAAKTRPDGGVVRSATAANLFKDTTTKLLITRTDPNPFHRSY